MRTIGLIGGMTWESTALYYRIMNQEVRARVGGHHSAPLLVASPDFDAISVAQDRGDWGAVASALITAARHLADAGADLLVIASNTAHFVADQVEAAAEMPLLNIIDVAARRLEEAGISSVAVLGTRWTMSDGFYLDRLSSNGIDAMIPEEPTRAEIDRIIVEELASGVIEDGSRRVCVDAIDILADEGAEGALLACTELGMLVAEDDARIPGFDTTRIHAVAAVDAALD